MRHQITHINTPNHLIFREKRNLLTWINFLMVCFHPQWLKIKTKKIYKKYPWVREKRSISIFTNFVEFDKTINVKERKRSSKTEKAKAFFNTVYFSENWLISRDISFPFLQLIGSTRIHQNKKNERKSLIKQPRMTYRQPKCQ